VRIADLVQHAVHGILIELILTDRVDVVSANMLGNLVEQGGPADAAAMAARPRRPPAQAALQKPPTAHDRGTQRARDD
jgi:hypothetical protein